jgi:hypothetical protein
VGEEVRALKGLHDHDPPWLDLEVLLRRGYEAHDAGEGVLGGVYGRGGRVGRAAEDGEEHRVLESVLMFD